MENSRFFVERASLVEEQFAKRKRRRLPDLSGQTSSTWNVTWKTIATEFFYEYADNTKLSGFYYLKRNISKGYIR